MQLKKKFHVIASVFLWLTKKTFMSFAEEKHLSFYELPSVILWCEIPLGLLSRDIFAIRKNFFLFNPCLITLLENAQKLTFNFLIGYIETYFLFNTKNLSEKKNLISCNFKPRVLKKIMFNNSYDIWKILLYFVIEQLFVKHVFCITI